LLECHHSGIAADLTFVSKADIHELSGQWPVSAQTDGIADVATGPKLPFEVLGTNGRIETAFAGSRSRTHESITP